MIKKAVRAIRSRMLQPSLSAVADVYSSVQRCLVLEGKNAAQLIRTLNTINHLSDAEFRVYSQWGEDGILEWLIQRIPISSDCFIEFGVENYREANTRFLLINRNWKGLIMDASSEFMRTVRQDEVYWRYDLRAVSAFVDRENINSLIAKNGIAGNIGVLSIDVDGNDYWIWEAIEVVNPDIVVCEYNGVFGDLHPITIPYAADFYRTRAHSSNLYFGASIGALSLLADRKGYELVGTNRAGINAFFVRRDLLPAISSCIASKSPFPSCVRESLDENGRLTFASGLERLELIADMPVVRLDTQKTVKLRELVPLYSRGWLEMMHVRTA